MKRKLLIVPVLALLIGVLFHGVAIAQPIGEIEDIEEFPSVGGLWSLNFTWLSGTTYLYIQQSGPFIVCVTGDGAWGLGLVYDDWIMFMFQGGCRPVYAGKVTSPTHMEGWMKCTEGEGEGTWYADKY